MINRHQCNVFGVLGACGRSVGLASFVAAMHLTNHSCLPNAAFDSMPTHGGMLTQDGFEFAAFGLRAIVDIAEGDEICHCYAGSADGPSQRLQYLRDHHGLSAIASAASVTIRQQRPTSRSGSMRCDARATAAARGLATHCPNFQRTAKW